MTKNDWIIAFCAALTYAFVLLTIFMGGRHLLLFGYDNYFWIIFLFGAFLFLMISRAEGINRTLNDHQLTNSVITQTVTLVMTSAVPAALYTLVCGK